MDDISICRWFKPGPRHFNFASSTVLATLHMNSSLTIKKQTWTKLNIEVENIHKGLEDHY